MVSEPIQTHSISLLKGPQRTLSDPPLLSYPFSDDPSTTHCPEMFSQQPPSPSLLIGDCIGAESCLDLMSLLERPKEADDKAVTMERRMTMRKSRRWETKEKRKEKEYPPPIPLLARTENLHSHMPWVLERTYTSDGRLILREERVRHHEYFRADRRDGRLTLQLVPLDDEVFNLENEAEAESEFESEANDNSASSSTSDNAKGDDHLQCSEAEIENRKNTSDCETDNTDKSEMAVDNDEPPTGSTVEIGGAVGKCLKVYNISGGVNVTGGGSSCIFGVAVPAL
ncbi:hypothetical protein CDL15_Pgr006226 [Punica granatum]|uniref:FAF domain-containing protein n=1 Tax=Punica granatum TaxID=22663 RepID=A0A218X6C6_PUNGR|nr:hypothetical protein CDL15_Pgr006226 [Punica granatum]PKI73867.1 hypothetical protein CRG98_005737 [Punica granatum]